MVVVMPVLPSPTINAPTPLASFQCSGEFVGIQFQFAIAGIGRDTNLRQRFIVGRTNGITQHRFQLRLNRPQRGVAEQCAIARTLAISPASTAVYLVRLLKVSISEL